LTVFGPGAAGNRQSTSGGQIGQQAIELFRWINANNL